MKKADTLSEKISREMVADSNGNEPATDHGISIASGNSNKSGQHDHIDVINQLFAELELAYHNQYHKAYAEEGSINLAKKYWLECLQHFSPQLILQATRTVVTSQEYLPSVASIIHACEDAMSSFGLLSVHDAYVEACCAANPKSEQNWSHAAVYLAGKETGWFDLANKPEARMYQLFEQHYRKFCQHVIHGKVLEIKIPLTLPEQPARQLTLEENKARMAALRKQLKT